jgi:hypothetical protein
VSFNSVTPTSAVEALVAVFTVVPAVAAFAVRSAMAARLRKSTHVFGSASMTLSRNLGSKPSLAARTCTISGMEIVQVPICWIRVA